jgi:N utilization substance protein B
MLFAADVVKVQDRYVTSPFWNELGDPDFDDKTREFSDRLVLGTLKNRQVIDEKIKTRAEHWRIERMALVDRNVLRLAVYEFLFEDTPHTVVIIEALEVARRFSTFEATQFIIGILDAIKLDLEKASKAQPDEKSHASSN